MSEQASAIDSGQDNLFYKKKKKKEHNKQRNSGDKYTQFSLSLSLSLCVCERTWMNMSYEIWLKVTETVPSKLEDSASNEGIIIASTLGN